MPSSATPPKFPQRANARSRPAASAMRATTACSAALSPAPAARAALLVGAAGSTLWGGRERSPRSAGSFLTDSRLGCGQRQVRRAGADLRHAGHRAHRHADRRAGQFRHRAVPDRSRAELAARPDRSAIELLAGIPSIIYGMWGLFVFVPFMAAHMIRGSTTTSGNVPLIGRAVPRPAARHRHAHRGHRAGDHDRSRSSPR